MLCVNVLFSLLLTWMSPAHAQIDLHAHLHMKPGLGFFLQGDFNEAPKADHWSDRVYTKVSAVSLAEMTKQTRPKLIVISLYAHPYLSYSFKRDGFEFDRKENVRRTIEQEYQEFLKFVEEHSEQFAIAHDASEARTILKMEKTVIVLSLEGAWATLDTPEDYQRWIEARGLAIVTPVHLTPDSLGGNALMTTLVSLADSTLDFIKSVWITQGSCLKNFCKSTEGFSSTGMKTVDELMKRKVWVDLAHANEKEVEVVTQKYEAGIENSGSLPLLITHTQLREYYPAERGLGQLEVNYIRKHDGIIGLLPSQFMMSLAMKQEKEEIPSAARKLSCISGLDVFQKTVAYAIATVGAPERVALASDVNAPLDGLSPTCKEQASGNSASFMAQLDLQRRGYYIYSQWNALTEFVTPDVSGDNQTTWADQSLEHFLTLWEKIRPSKNR